MHYDTGNTGYVLTGAAFVLLMVFGVAWFYGGGVLAKNVLGMIKQNIAALSLGAITWAVITYSIAFGGANAWWGGLRFIGMAHMNDPVPGYTGPLAMTIPPVAFISFQLMFGAITMALITGATANRWRFGGFLAFMTMWSILVYGPVAHVVFSPVGWLFQKGFEDLAGGLVVHANAGAAAIAVALVLGPSAGWKRHQAPRPHDVTKVWQGMGLLWFGWYGFNCCSALAANQLASVAFLNTTLATAAAFFGWLIAEKLRDGSMTPIGGAAGAVAGLVAITPACGFVSPMGAIAIGAIAGLLCAFATSIKGHVGIDDYLDVGAVHLAGGVIGALLIGFFGTKGIGGANGFFYGGGFHLLGIQALGVAIVVPFSFVVSYILAFGINKVKSMSLTPAEQEVGYDKTLFRGTAAYIVDPGHLDDEVSAAGNGSSGPNGHLTKEPVG